MHSRRRGEQNLPEYFFTCSYMTNLVDRFHVKNCLKIRSLG